MNDEPRMTATEILRRYELRLARFRYAQEMVMRPIFDKYKEIESRSKPEKRDDK